MYEGEGVRTGKACGFLESDPHLCRIPPTVATIQEERWIPKGVYGRCPAICRFWGIRRYNNQSVLARWAEETVPGTSVQYQVEKLSDGLLTATYLFFSPLTLALGTSNRQFGQ